MKNIHILPTDKPSNYVTNYMEQTMQWQHIYITSDEEIKDWYINISSNTIHKSNGTEVFDYRKGHQVNFKIILTTDQDLIKDGVQAIDDEFLNWFVKNPSCEEVVIEREKAIGYAEGRQRTFYGKYKIIIPKEESNLEKHLNYLSEPEGIRRSAVVKEESKQETLEEVDENKKNLYYYKQVMNPYSVEEYSHTAYEKGFIEGYQESTKWQQARSYSEEDIKEAFFSGCQSEGQIKPRIKCWGEWFEQFKKK